MSNVATFLIENQETLDLYTTAITRAHAAHHPEVFEVQSIYKVIQEKVRKGENIKEDFVKLREITNEFFIPDDVCQTFEKTYKLFAQADKLTQEN